MEVHFLIVDAANDTKVLSAIKEREKDFFKKGYETVFGLRDMYSDEYCKRSSIIDDGLIRNFIDRANQTISEMSSPENIHLHFAIMEIEAWFLGMYNLFCKIDNTLSIEFIEERVGYNLREIDPQREFYKPADELDRIFRLIDGQYQKSQQDANRIASQIDETDCANATENGRCQSFNDFYHQLLNAYDFESSSLS